MSKCSESGQDANGMSLEAEQQSSYAKKKRRRISSDNDDDGEMEKACAHNDMIPADEMMSDRDDDVRREEADEVLNHSNFIDDDDDKSHSSDAHRGVMRIQRERDHADARALARRYTEGTSDASEDYGVPKRRPKKSNKRSQRSVSSEKPHRLSAEESSQHMPIPLSKDDSPLVQRRRLKKGGSRKIDKSEESESHGVKRNSKKPHSMKQQLSDHKRDILEGNDAKESVHSGGSSVHDEDDEIEHIDDDDIMLSALMQKKSTKLLFPDEPIHARVSEMLRKVNNERESILPTIEELMTLFNDVRFVWGMLDSQKADVDIDAKVKNELYGGPFHADETHMEERVNKWLSHYANTVSQIWMLCNYVVTDEAADANVRAVKSRFIKSIEKRITNTHKMKLLQLENYNDMMGARDSKMSNNPLGEKDDFDYVPFLTSMMGEDELKNVDPHVKFLLYCEEEASKLFLMRKGNDFYAPIRREGTGEMMNAYRFFCTISEFVFECGSKNKNLQQFLNRVKRTSTTGFVESELTKNRNGIKTLDRDRTCWSFSNVLYDPRNGHISGNATTIDTCDRIYRYEDGNLPNKIAARSIDYPLRDMDPIGPDYYGPSSQGVAYDEDMVLIPCLPKGDLEPTQVWLDEKGYVARPRYWIHWDDTIYNGAGGWKRNIKSWMDIATPVFDTLLITQKLSRPVRKIAHVLCGRLAFWLGIENGGDNWQITPLFYGTAGTGKSTIIRYVCQMYENDDVFDLESTGEEVFLLWRCVDPVVKWVWRNLEVKAGLRLSSDRYQLMTDGVRMTIPRKGTSPWEGAFLAPGAQAGNDRLPYKDAQGSIARRTPTIEFPEQVIQDTTLLEKSAPELPDLIRKNVMGYIYFREWVNKRKLFDCLPSYFKATTLNLQKNVNEVIKYFYEQTKWSQNSGIITATNEYHEIPLSDFMKAIKMDTGSNRITEDQITSSLREPSIGLEIINYDKIHAESANKDIADLERTERNPHIDEDKGSKRTPKVSLLNRSLQKKGIWIRGLELNVALPMAYASGQYSSNARPSAGSTQYVSQSAAREQPISFNDKMFNDDDLHQYVSI